MDDGGSRETIPPEEWKDLMELSWDHDEECWTGPIVDADIETVAQLLEDPKIREFINWKNDSFAGGNTMLISAMCSGRMDIARLLLDHNADPSIGDKYGTDAFMSCCNKGDNETIQFLLAKGMDPNKVDKIGYNALMHAVEQEEERTDIVQLLLDHGTDAKRISMDGKTALETAMCYSNFEVVELLLPVMIQGSEIPLDWAKLMLNVIEEFSFANIELETFIERWMQHPQKESFINWSDGHIADGETMLHCAIRYKRFDIVAELLKNGADVNIASIIGETPLMLASSKGYTDTARLLLANGANVNAKTEHGRTSLHFACFERDLDTIKLLMQNGADANAKHNNYFTPLELAYDKDYLEEVKCMIQNGADQNFKNGYGMSLLHRACFNGNIKVVELLLLLSGGQNVNSKTTRGNKTPLQIASERNYSNIVWFLIRQYHQLVLEEGVVSDGKTECLEVPPRKRPKYSSSNERGLG